MIAKDAYEALLPTLEDIAGILKAQGLDAEVRRSFSDVDLFDQSTELPSSALLYGEIRFSKGEDAAALECAVSVIEGKVSDDELVSELSSLREEAKRIATLAQRVGADRLFAELIKDGEEEPVDYDAKAEEIFADAWDRAADELERDLDVLSYDKEKRMVSLLPYLIGGAAVLAIILLIVLL